MPTKIKLLVDGHVFDGMFQGTRTYLRGLYRALAKLQVFDIYIAASDVDNLAKEFQGCEVNLIKLKSNSGVGRLLFEFPKIIKAYGIDYIHYQYMDAPIKNCKTIITTHDVLFLDFPGDFSWAYRQKKHLFKLAARRADLLFTVSNYSKSRISYHFGIPEDKISVQKEAIEDSYFESFDKQTAVRELKEKFGMTKVIVYVSRVEPRKNHTLLLQAFLELKLWKKGYHLVFIGKPSIKYKDLEYMLDGLSPEQVKYVHQLHSVEQHDLVHFLQAAEMFVYPTKAEGFGFPPLEAAAMEVPTLLSNATSLKEFSFFEDRFFSPEHIEELKEKMNRMCLAPESFKSMSEISATIKRDYDWNKIAEDFAAHVLLNDHGSRRL